MSLSLDAIEKYIDTLARDEQAFKQSASTSPETKSAPPFRSHYSRLVSGITFFVRSLIDFIRLYLLVRFNEKSLHGKRIVYTTKNFCNVVEGKLEDRVLKPLFTDNILFINPSKEHYLETINGQKVYNLGGVARLLSYFFKRGPHVLQFFRAYRVVNDAILKHLSHREVYTLWFYNVNSLSLIFSYYRKNITLIEVQHGSMINYPPFAHPAPVKIADLFYVKNQATIDYLKTHLCLNFPSEYRLIPYARIQREYVPGIHLLYASTVEFNGLHPVMHRFLATFRRDDLHLIIRLHPREKEKEPLFAAQLAPYQVNYRFDHSPNWLEGNPIQNLMVVSAWSSMIEDSYDNGLLTILIDPVGKARYEHLVDHQRCIYTDDLTLTLEKLLTASRV